MARTKEPLTVDAEDSLREKKSSSRKRKNRRCPVPPQGVLKGLNTSFADTILRDPPEADQMTTERKKGRFRRVLGSHLFRRTTWAKFASSLDIRKPPTLPTPIPSSNGPYPARQSNLQVDFAHDGLAAGTQTLGVVHNLADNERKKMMRLFFPPQLFCLD